MFPVFRVLRCLLPPLALLAGCGGGGGGSSTLGGESAPPVAPGAALTAPALPRSGFGAADLAVVIALGDATSEAIGLAYQSARGIPEANMVRVAVPTGSDVVAAADFATLKVAIDARLPAGVQATLLTFTRPSRVQGSCTMGITSAMALGYDSRWCSAGGGSGQCLATQSQTYFDTDTTRPFTDLQIRPSMMLGAATLTAAQALIARGLAADGSQPTGTGYLVRTADVRGTVRFPDMQAMPALWAQAPGPAMRYIDAGNAAAAQFISGQTDVLFYFTGLAAVPAIATNRYLPGAAADHLTSYGGFLPDGNGQMPVTDWLAAGVTASYGTVEEPCALVQKFPKVSVMVEQYVRGATLIEAYWKSVQQPGQGLFVGEPLARPWSQAPSATLESGALVIRTRSLRRGAPYRIDFLAAGGSDWQTLASMSAGQPAPTVWTVPLPAVTTGGQLRFVGPCATQPAQSCVLGVSS